MTLAIHSLLMSFKITSTEEYGMVRRVKRISDFVV